LTIERVSADPEIMGGAPCVAGTRIPVATIIGRLAEGSPAEEILSDYPQLNPDDLHACLLWVSR
jgi:uncharacterized protein (DUF433 family)